MASSIPPPVNASPTSGVSNILLSVEIAIAIVAVAVVCLAILAAILFYINRSTKRQLSDIQEELRRTRERRRLEKEKERRDLFPSTDSGCSQGEKDNGGDSNQQPNNVFPQGSTTEPQSFENRVYEHTQRE